MKRASAALHRTAPVDADPAFIEAPLHQHRLPYVSTNLIAGGIVEMRTATILAASIATLSASANEARTPAATTEQHLIDLEKQSWVAWQNMDVGFWSRFLSNDHMEISGFVGLTGKAEVVGAISAKVCKVNSYAIDHFTFRQLDARNAVLVYHAQQDTMCGSVKVPSPVWATSLYQLRRGRWQNVLYEHTPALALPTKK